MLGNRFCEPSPFMSLSPSFNALDEPWIPVINRTGVQAHLSLLDLLDNAGDYAAIPRRDALDQYRDIPRGSRHLGAGV